MKISLMELIAEISKLEKEINSQTQEIRQNAKSTYIQEIGGLETLTTEAFEFDTSFIVLEKNMEKLIAYKSALAEMNSKTLIDGKSIHFVMNTLKQNRELVKAIEHCLSKKGSTQRRTDGSGPSASYYVVDKPNYNKDSLEDTKMVLEQENLTLEAQLQKANLTAIVEIEDQAE